ncbi:MAG: polyketide synthase, partial [Fimbriiglobus sp.]
PPQANFAEPGAGLKYADGPFRVLTAAEPWQPRSATAPRRAAVSGFGFGGVNAHVLLEEYVGQYEAGGVLVDAPVPSALNPRPSTLDPVPVAVVGLAARFGPWETLREFQERVLGGGSDIGPSPKRNGWGLADAECPPAYGIEAISAPLARFRIPPRELEAVLPQQLLMLHAAADAIDDSGMSLGGPDPRTGVFVGLGLDANTTNYHLRWAAAAAGATGEQLDAVSPPLTADRTMGALGSIAASRVARAFGFGGPSFTCCSEETSAGRAVELAVRALRNGEIDRAVAGGVDLTADPRTLLPTAAIRGESTPGEGAAALVLKRLSDAERDGDRVYAVIRGVGSGGGGAVETAGPDASAYASAFLRACGDGVVSPTALGYLDAADDAPERDALGAMLAATGREFPLGIGAVSKQIGNTGFASAAAGLVKACLALHHRILPPSPVAVTPG